MHNEEPFETAITWGDKKKNLVCTSFLKMCPPKSGAFDDNVAGPTGRNRVKMAGEGHNILGRNL